METKCDCSEMTRFVLFGDNVSDRHFQEQHQKQDCRRMFYAIFMFYLIEKKNIFLVDFSWSRDD